MSAPGTTPGPWSVSNGSLVRINAASQEYAWNRPVCVAGVHRIGRFLGKEREGETLANGRLIAAAPDLYAALTHALGVIVEFGDLNGFRNMTNAELGSVVTSVARECAEALTKSRGEA